MILQSLTNYYETLLERDEIAPRYYAKTGVSYGLKLSEEGELIAILPLQITVTMGKKTVGRPQPLNLPESVVRSSGIQPNFLWDNAAYLLGLNTKGDAERALRCFESAKELHLSILDGVPGLTAQTIRNFFLRWQPLAAAEHPLVQPYLEGLTGASNLVFLGAGVPYAFEDADIRAAWARYRGDNEGEFRAQCLVTGLPDQPIERVHPKVKGVQGGQMAGVSLVSMNATAFESYDMSANFNAPVSEYAAFAYTSALNHLIADFDHRMMLDGDTVVCWADSGEAQYQDAYLQLVNPRAATEKEVSDTFRDIVSGRAVDLANFHPETPFHVLCLSPNAARVSVRFFLSDTFGRIAENLAAHYRRLEIAMGPGERPYLSLYWMLKETVPAGSKDDAASPLLAGAVLRAILSGAPYPAMLYESILTRIRADRKINRALAATIKAYLIQNVLPKHPEYEEVLQVALNDQSNLKPYVLGRLFALLEQAQENANPGINATITDRFFDAACATPRLAFSTLLKLNRHHLAKDEKWGRRNEKLIGELLDKLEAEQDPYPARLTLDEQGLFILGYYHQKQARFIKKENQNKEDKDAEKENQ